ncbi:UNVERIFIED_CONTAM: Retrovirus-related Pol polyprotein from transposon TNT 1-94 [Sesamum radiatum]|uniref:Retrovirus-related Pol polyprotein from transposon TNT 1-94 n=1 Tax=Sesamum radiatum TaxID=300843 RepID=A0AAW2T6F5_SESRA
MTKKPFDGQSAIANGLLDLVHTNNCGSLSIPARGGFSYFITFTDDHSRYGYVYLMRYKSEAFRRFEEYRLEVENQTNRKIKALRSDRGDSQRDEVLIEESSKEPQHDSTTSFKPSIHTDGVPVLCRSTRESRVPERYGFVGLTSQLDNDPKTYEEVMSDIDSDKWLEAIKSEMDSMDSNQMLEDIKVWLSTQFSMKDMGEASYIHGIKIYRDRSRRMLGLIQSSYIEKVLKRFKMEHSKMPNIPYASALESIQYAVQCTRPDVAYALSVTSRYQACAGEAHWGAVKSILKYLKRTKDMFLIYGGGELILEGYSDASFESDDDDAKSQSSFVFKPNGDVVAWKSSKQDTTADSTTEAEYIEALEAAKEAVLDEKLHPRVGCGT